MRIRTILTVLFVTLTLVVSLDYVSFAATGKSLLLGKGNTAAKATRVTRTTPGPVLSLKAKPGSPGLAVSNHTLVPKLNADLLDGLHAKDLASHVTAIQPAGCQTLVAVTTSLQKVGNLGTFTTTRPGRFTRIDLANNVSVASMQGTAVVFELRVDNLQTTSGKASLLLRQAGISTPAQISGIFPALGVGEHTISVWARGVNGAATSAYLDRGCYASAGVNNIYVTEFR